MIRISDYTLERYLLGELPPAEMNRVGKMISDDGELKKRVEEMKRENELILDRYPSSEFMKVFKNKVKEERKDKKIFHPGFLSGRRYIFSGALASALIFVAGFVFLFNGVDQFNGSGSDDLGVVRMKGADKLYLYKKGEQIAYLEQDSRVKEGDLIQIAYQVDKDKNGVIFSVDGNGCVTLHYPKEVNDSSSLMKGGKQFLDYSFELDNAPQYEKFFFVTSMDRKDIDELLEKIIAETDSGKNIEDGILKKGSYSVYSISLLKDGRR